MAHAQFRKFNAPRRLNMGYRRKMTRKLSIRTAALCIIAGSGKRSIVPMMKTVMPAPPSLMTKFRNGL